MSRRNQNPWTPEAKTGVNYFKHSTKHFLTPYGKTHGILTSRKIVDKLFNWNCEWLTRPNYTISELADTLYSNLATLAEYRDKVFTRQPVDTLLNKARPIRTVLQRFNKKDSSTAEEPDAHNLATLMKFIEDDTLKTLSKDLFTASGAMYSVATHLMTLQTLFSHPAEFAKKHRESPEVQAFKQNPSRESMVAYIAGETLTHSEIVPEDEQGANIWDLLTQQPPSRQPRQSATFWDALEENPEDEDQGNPYEDDQEEEAVTAPRCRRARPNTLEDKDEEYEDDEPFNTPESSAEHALFITQPDPKPYHEPGTVSRSQKGKAPAARKRPASTANIWASFGLTTHDADTSGINVAPPQKKKATTGRGRGSRTTTRGTTSGRARGTRDKRGQATARHIYFD